MSYILYFIDFLKKYKSEVFKRFIKKFRGEKDQKFNKRIEIKRVFEKIENLEQKNRERK